MSDHANVLPEEVLKDAYFDYLCKIVDVDVHQDSYKCICNFLHGMSAYSTYPRDLNIESDGKELRETFLSENYFLDAEHALASIGECTVFEYLIVIAKTMAFNIDDSSETENYPKYFRELLDNLCVLFPNWRFYVGEVSENLLYTRVSRFLDRDYRANGRGGLFPLKHPKPGVQMQKIEIWDQMQMYLDENYPVS